MPFLEMEQLHHKKHNFGYTSVETYATYCSACSGQAAVLCRQHSTQAQGLETRQLHNRFSIPVGTRCVGYLTKLLKPQFNEQNFEESLTTWEFETTQYERNNQAPIPDNIKIAVLLNETKGALQQYLQLRAGTIQRYADVRELILEIPLSIPPCPSVDPIL